MKAIFFSIIIFCFLFQSSCNQKSSEINILVDSMLVETDSDNLIKLCPNNNFDKFRQVQLNKHKKIFLELSNCDKFTYIQYLLKLYENDIEISGEMFSIILIELIRITDYKGHIKVANEWNTYYYTYDYVNSQLLESDLNEWKKRLCVLDFFKLK